MRECHLAPEQTVQPAHARMTGLDFQVVGQAQRPVELAAEPGDRLQPRLARDLELIEDRQRQRDHSTGPLSQLTTWSVEQRHIALQRHPPKPTVAGSTSTPRSDSLRGRGGSLRRGHRCRQRFGTLIQLDSKPSTPCTYASGMQGSGVTCEASSRALKARVFPNRRCMAHVSAPVLAQVAAEVSKCPLLKCP